MLTKTDKQKATSKPPQNVAENSVFCYSDFTGKELDPETGFSYFGARYLDHTLLTSWFTVDPMSDKYLSISPYAYCAWNPVKLVDPNGKEDYEVDRSGNIRKCTDQSHSTEDKDRLFKKPLLGHVKFDKKGNPKSTFIEAKRGTFGKYNPDSKNGIIDRSRTYNTSADIAEICNAFEIRFNEGTIKENEQKAFETFEFLSKNTIVEWTLFGLSINDEKNVDNNIITTSRMVGYDPYSYYKAKSSIPCVVYCIHTHRNALGPSPEHDLKLKEILPNAILGVYHTWTDHYFDFDGEPLQLPLNK